MDNKSNPEEFSIEINELEFKYKADDIKRAEFIKFAESMNPTKTLEIYSEDTYHYGNEHKLPFEYIRHRPSAQELTVKIRTSDKNNNTRIEVDLPLAKVVPQKIISTFCGLLGFKKSFKIYKDCTIFWYDKVDIVYYIVYNEDKEEKGRFVEVEAIKNGDTSISREEAWQAVKDMEAKLSALGISSQNRMKRSLWDLFKRE